MGRRVLLVGYEDQDNLGIRYLSSRLLQDGHFTRIAAFSGDPGDLIRLIRAEQPDIVGFSLIFQYMVPAFASVIRALRDAGVNAHITLGGHYASFEPEELLRQIPELDSVVRFEGEDTLAELVSKLDDPFAWRHTPGISWLDKGTIVNNPLRIGRSIIDDFAEPDRREIDYRTQILPTASVLGSRGCPWKCSFCSIKPFYEANGTKGRRLRDPVQVVNEVEALVRKRGVKLILFQDDDFLAGGAKGRAWAHAIAAEILRRGLQSEMRFKIACRSDEIRRDELAPLVAAGLCHVYVGVESGDEADLDSLNKLLKPAVHLRAGEILRELDLSFDFGFMLLEPWSMLRTARSNMEFLREFTKDGWSVAGFCRTLPYAGTEIERRLRKEGRLHGPTFDADYSFLDPQVDLLWNFCLMAFEGRNFGTNATWNLLRGLLFNTHFEMLGRPRDSYQVEAARALVQASNGLMLDVLEEALDAIEDGSASSLNDSMLLGLARFARNEDRRIRRQLCEMDQDRAANLDGTLARSIPASVHETIPRNDCPFAADG